MFQVTQEQQIYITRGDTIEMSMQINVGTTLNPAYYTLTENDKIFFAIMECNQRFEDAIVKKTFTEDDINEDTGLLDIVILPKDTEFLQPGQYYYEVKLVTYVNNNGTITQDEVQTIIQKRKLFIMD